MSLKAQYGLNGALNKDYLVRQGSGPITLTANQEARNSWVCPISRCGCQAAEVAETAALRRTREVKAFKETP